MAGSGRRGPAAARAPPRSPRFAPVDIALLVLLGVVWGLAYIFIREGLVLGATPLAYAAARYALSAAAFGAIASVRRERWPSARRAMVSAGVGGLLVIGLYGGLLYWGEQYTSGGFASVLSTTAPILTVVAAFGLLRHERLGPVSLAGIGVGFAGTVVLVLPSLLAARGTPAVGPLTVIGAFVSAAVGSVLLRKYGGGPQGMWQIGVQFAVAAALLGGASALLPVREALPLSADLLTALGLLVVLSSVVGYLTFFTLHHRVGPVRANTVTYLIPLVGLAVGSGVYGEPLSVAEVVGFGIVLVGMTLLFWEARSASAGSLAPPAGTAPAER